MSCLLYTSRYLRLHADELGICPDKIAIGGFSAGGMLSAYAATQFSYGNLQAVDAAERVSSRPDAALILYGAMSDSGIQDSGMFAVSYTHLDVYKRQTGGHV